jgi:biotin-dependent carboxylase-like uncharacterized protein
MAFARLRVVQAGPLITLQDAGRPGFLRFGVPASGPMDRQSHAIANASIGNDPRATAIEVSLGGLVLDCLEGELTLAVAGGGFQVLVDERALGAWRAFRVCAGERITIRPGFWGSWTYLAVAGQLVAPEWLGSRATLALSDLGGGKLVAGQEIRIEDAALREERHGAITCPADARPRHHLHVVLGPQNRRFSRETISRFLSDTFAVTTANDRMGMRLAGPSLAPKAALDIPSEGILRGSVQVSGEGVATILLADHQTTGGYPKIATILSGDLDGFVQLRPRDSLRFSAITPEDAVRMARLRAEMGARYAAHLGR